MGSSTPRFAMRSLLGRLHLVVVASGQEGIPQDLTKENSSPRLVPVRTLSDLVDLLYEEDGPRASVRQSVRESTQKVDLIGRPVDLLPEDPDVQVFQIPPLLREQSSDDLQRLFKAFSQAPSAAEIATLDPAHVALRVSEFLTSQGVKVAPPPEPAVSAWHEDQLTPAPPLDPNAMSPDDMFAESAGLPRVVLGSPGGGKSTLLNYMCRVLPEAGSAAVAGGSCRLPLGSLNGTSTPVISSGRLARLPPRPSRIPGTASPSCRVTCTRFTRRSRRASGSVSSNAVTCCSYSTGWTK